MSILAIIPARSGSKGFVNKNISIIEGKTLLELAVKVGLDCNQIDDVYISTDSTEYEIIAKNAGAKSLGLRPSYLASDDAKSIDLVIDLLNKLDKVYEYVVLLQPTSPLREPKDIEKMLEIIFDTKAMASVSISKHEEPHPYKLKAINKDGFISPFIEGTTSEVPRQLLSESFALNGAIYICETKIIQKERTFLPLKTIPYIMKNNVNIDTEDDFLYLKYLKETKQIKIYGIDSEYINNQMFELCIKKDAIETDIILGHNSFMLNGYNRSNIKLKGGWYFRNISTNLEFLEETINKYNFQIINFIGSSKSCSGAIMLSKFLQKKFPNIKFNLFLFSAYTSVDKKVYIRRKVNKVAPDSLKNFWKTDRHNAKMIQRMEARELVNVKNVELYFIYPTLSKNGEKEMVDRIQNGKNVHKISIPVYMHNTLFPFWKKVDENKEIELYEGVKRHMHQDDYSFYSELQNNNNYNFNIYNVIENPKKFQKEIESFIKDYKNKIIISPTTIISKKNVVLEEPISIYRNCIINSDTLIRSFTYINSGTKIFSNVEIGRYCSVGEDCTIGAKNHPMNWLSSSPFQYSMKVHFPSSINDCIEIKQTNLVEKTLIGNDVWIGSKVFIKEGLSIGNGAIIGAGSIVTKDVPDYAIVAGNPAKIIRYRFDADTITELQELLWWNLDPKDMKDVKFDNIRIAIEEIKKIK